jgi:hypothetical protein
MTTAIEDANTKLRQAVEIRREAQAAGKPHEEWYATMQAKGGATADDIIERFGNVSQPVTEALPEVAEAEETQHVEWDRIANEQYLDDLLEQQRLRGDGLLNREQPGSLPFLELLEELRQLHFEKTGQYGGVTDPFENVTASAKCGVEPWRRALCDLSDCVVRMQRYANGQPVDYENALIDAANWSLICLLKLREAKRG